MNSFLEIAIRNAARGFKVHPLHPRDKRPLLSDWPSRATTDQIQIEEWSKRYPEANCGVMCSDGICVLESDNFTQLSEMLDRPLPHTFTVQARENRPHLYFRATEGAKRLGPRTLPEVFEFKIGNFYVVSEGSISPYGPTYEVVNNSTISDLPTWLPDALLKLVLEHKPQGKESAPVEGGRNIHLTSVAGKLRNAGLSREAMELALLQYNDEKCIPPLPDDEVKHIAASVARYDVPEQEPEIVFGNDPAERRADDWRQFFHTKDQMLHAPPISFLIKDYLMCEGVTAIAAPVRERKSLIALNIVHALLTGEKLFDHFEVVKKPSRVLYLCPEVSLGPFTDRLRKIGLMDFVGETLFCRTLSADGHLKLNEPALKEALPSSVVIHHPWLNIASGLPGGENTRS